MPTGIYKRTAEHRTICSKAGYAAAASINRKIKEAERHVFFVCIGCDELIETTFSRIRLYCTKQCMIEALHSDSYGVMHNRVRKIYGTPSECEHCGTIKSKKFEWANITGIMEVARQHWRRLCCRCHRRFDLGTKNKIEVT